jgi:hypothetical protein
MPGIRELKGVLIGLLAFAGAEEPGPVGSTRRPRPPRGGHAQSRHLGQRSPRPGSGALRDSGRLEVPLTP